MIERAVAKGAAAATRAAEQEQQRRRRRACGTCCGLPFCCCCCCRRRRGQAPGVWLLSSRTGSRRPPLWAGVGLKRLWVGGAALVLLLLRCCTAAPLLLERDKRSGNFVRLVHHAECPAATPCARACMATMVRGIDPAALGETSGECMEERVGRVAGRLFGDDWS